MDQLNSEWVKAPDWNTLPPLTIQSTTLEGNSVTLDCGVARLSVTMVEVDGGIAVRLQSIDARVPDYGLLVAEPPQLNIEVVETEESLTMRCQRVDLYIDKSPLSFRVEYDSNPHALQSPTDGHFVRRHRVPPIARSGDHWFMGINLKSNEAVFGLGEKWGKLDKRGQLVRSYNSDALGVNAEISYKNTPFCWSHEGWGVFVHTPSSVTHAVGFAPWSQRSYIVQIEDHRLDVFYLLCPPSDEQHNAGEALLAQYTALTGKAPLPPLWSTGVILSKAYYRDADEILGVASQVREARMPCDVITFDGRAWQDTDTRFAFEWDATRYPNPQVVIEQLKALNFKICVWEYPLISVRHPWFKDFASKGWLLKDVRTGQAFEYDWDQQAFGKVLTPLPRSGMVDFTHPDAYAFWRDAHRPLFELGVDMIKADFGEQLESEHLIAHNGERGRALHNVYAHLYNRCVYEAAEQYSPSGPFLFSRSSWIGCQRFNSQWGGDPQADWEGMMGNLRGGLSWGMSGGPFYATDVGGFYKDTRDDLLYVRWAQMAIFSAHFRLHGIGPREPWSYSPDAALAVTQALTLRYQLQAYIFAQIKKSVATGMPVQRAMALAFPEQRESWAFENQLMFGEDLLVVPCFEPSGRVEFYLPSGDWTWFCPRHACHGRVLQGKHLHTAHLDIAQIAVFAKVGTRIPLSAAREFTDETLQAPDITEYWTA